MAPSIWPPDDFELLVEELQVDVGGARTVRQLRVSAEGLVVYGTAERHRVESTTGAVLPVFDRLSVYQLVPTCVRALARRLDRLGVTRIDTVQGERGGTFTTSVQLSWRAFGEQRSIRATGRVAGPMAEIFAVVAAHMPRGEYFGLPGLEERAVSDTLHGVPLPATHARAALRAHQELLESRPGDVALMLQGFALACDVGDLDAANKLLLDWSRATDARRHEQFPDQVQLTPQILAGMLPAQ